VQHPLPETYHYRLHKSYRAVHAHLSRVKHFEPCCTRAGQAFLHSACALHSTSSLHLSCQYTLNTHGKLAWQGLAQLSLLTGMHASRLSVVHQERKEQTASSNLTEQLLTTWHVHAVELEVSRLFHGSHTSPQRVQQHWLLCSVAHCVGVTVGPTTNAADVTNKCCPNWICDLIPQVFPHKPSRERLLCICAGQSLQVCGTSTGHVTSTACHDGENEGFEECARPQHA
jgi:hypothetical protein